MNKYQTYSLIGKILALDSIPTHRDMISNEIQNRDVAWERFVSLADHHRVLQALYPKIRDHRIEDLFPREVLEHLKYIFDLNTTRNLSIIAQTEKLTSILRKAGITSLYMKGVGNILDDLYKYPGERILHDIDLLVTEEKFEEAADILISDGYKTNYPYYPDQKSRNKHYPILFKPGEPVYVEIHHMPVSSRHKKYFNTKMTLASAKSPSAYPDCLVMSDEHKIIHNFIHAQLDHPGRIYAREFMRNLYDLLLLTNRKDPEVVFYEMGYFTRASSSYLDISYDTFSKKRQHRKSPKFFLHTYRYRYYLNLRYRYIEITSLFLTRIFLGYVVKPLKAITDKELRRKLISDLGSREWYRKQGLYYKKLFSFRGRKT